MLRLRGLLATVAVLAVVGAVLSIYLVHYVAEATEDRRDALHARTEAVSRQVATQATQLLATSPALSAQLALASYRISPTPHARSALLDATARPLATRLAGPEGTVRAVVAPGGAQFATATDSGEVRIWEVPEAPRSPEPVGAVDARGDGPLFAAAYSPDGRTLAVGGIDGTVTLVDVSRPAEPRVLDVAPDGPSSAVQSLAFSPDGRVLAAAASDPALYRWRLDGGAVRALAPATDFGGSVQDVAYSPDGRLLATASADGTVRIWGWGAGPEAPMRELHRLPVGDSSNFVHAVAYSADGRWLAAGAKDKRVRVWDVAGRGRRPPSTCGSAGSPRG